MKNNRRIILALSLITAINVQGMARPDNSLLWGNQNSQKAIVQTGSGTVQGVADKRETWSWKGIPFAQAPIGQWRWRAPQSVSAWKGVKLADTLAEPCAQLNFGQERDVPRGDAIGSEDCLYLNVWRPQTTQQKLPVYVWIHGGGFQSGSTASPVFDGANLARQSNMMVVTVAYRLGPLGWFNNPVLYTGDKQDDSGNYGTLDIIKSLEWVKNNIAQFGGDPANVTIAGSSAGAVNVLSLLTSPAASGLFHRAIAQSPIRTSTSLEQAIKSSDRAIAQMLINSEPAKDRAAVPISHAQAKHIQKNMTKKQRKDFLYSLDVRALYHAYPVDPSLPFRDQMPVIVEDGQVIHHRGFASFISGDYPNKVPLIIGSNKGEMRAISSFGTFSNDQVRSAFIRYGSDLWKIYNVDGLAKLLSRYQKAIYAYQFLWGSYKEDGSSQLPPPYDKRMGASHSAESAFLFGNDVAMVPGMITSQNKPGRKALSAAMMHYFANFASSGNPNIGQKKTAKARYDFARWPRWTNTPGIEKLMLFDSKDQSAWVTVSNRALSTDALLEDMKKTLSPDDYQETWDALHNNTITRKLLTSEKDLKKQGAYASP